MQRRIYSTAFISGLVSLAIELSASRLLSNYFGTTNLIWAVIIGSILVYMAIGSMIGGKWADRDPREEVLYTNIAWAALTTGLIPSIAKPILRQASQAMNTLQIAPLIISFVVVLLLFSIPMILLSMTTPFAIRLVIRDKQTSGNIAGKLSALSTVGSFLGTFLPGLVLIPAIGTFRTFLVLSALLFLNSIYGLWKVKVGWKKFVFRILWMPLVVLLSAFLGLRGSDKIAQGLIYEDESAYNYIQVQHIEGYTLLRLNEGQGIHSIYHQDILDYQRTWRQVVAAPFFNPAPYSPEEVHSVAILGLAGGTSARQVAEVFPNAHIDGFEIDEDIIQVGNDFFGMDIPQLTVYAQDARLGLNQSPKEYQLISIDAYRPPYIPAHLTTLEFFQEIYDHLSDDGVLVINVARIGDDRRLVDALAATINKVFPTVFSSDVPDTFNTILYATRQSTQLDNLFQNYLQLSGIWETSPLLAATLETTILNLQPVTVSEQFFTDDKAPVEKLVNTIMIDFFLSGGTQDLQ